MKAKLLLLWVALFAAGTMFYSCKEGAVGPAGPAGEAGPAGPAGPAGATGPQGPVGNANVIQISYASRVHSGSELSYTLTGITIDQVASSAFFCYVRVAGFWYALPGNATSSFSYRTFTRATGTSQFFINRLTGSGNQTFESTRIVIIPANDLRNGRLTSLDFNDYEAVKEYYNLPD